MRLTPSDRWGLGPVRRERVRWVVRRLFGQRRKQLQKLLRTLPPWALDPASVSRIGEEAGIDLRQRPEMLGVEEWLRLEESLARAGFSTLAG
ncbi:MAG: hypothetical protein H0W29_14610 [Gemmatimonadales bacterium]|nr:hypothetical protein [Gemmatimonadales bacterium]